MRTMIITILSFLAGYSNVRAQQVPRQVIVEHFTNTYCSVCADRNPGFYNNLAGFPEILHIAYHPSSPYPACPVNQHNKPENDARTQFYGIYGGTPRLVIEGNVISELADYSAAALFSPYLAGTASFGMRVMLEKQGNSLNVTVTVKKTDTSSQETLDLYGVLVEDTLNFMAANGEQLHQDVFRKSFSGTDPVSITAPANPGDSVVYTQTVPLNGTWTLSQCYAVAMISTPVDKQILQAARSERVQDMATAIEERSRENDFHVYPMPAGQHLWVQSAYKGVINAVVFDLSGKKMKECTLYDRQQTIDLSGMQPGNYLLRLQTEQQTRFLHFVHL